MEQTENPLALLGIDEMRKNALAEDTNILDRLHLKDF